MKRSGGYFGFKCNGSFGLGFNGQNTAERNEAARAEKSNPHGEHRRKAQRFEQRLRKANNSADYAAPFRAEVGVLGIGRKGKDESKRA